MTKLIQTKYALKGWNKFELGEVGEFKRGPFGSSVQKSVCVPKGSDTYKLYEQGNVINNDFERGIYYLNQEKFNELKGFEIKPGDILITCAGTLGKIAIVPNGIERGIINSVLMRIRLNETKINKKYFIYFFGSQEIQNEIQRKSAGVALKNLFATKQLKKFVIPLPSLSEQTLIVSAIETQFTRLNEAVKSLKAVKEKLEIYRKAVLKKAFDNLETKPLIEFCNNFKQDIVDGPFGSDLQRKDYLTKGIPVLKIQNVKENKVVLKKMDYISQDKYVELERHSFKPGDIVLTKLGNPLGVAAIIPPELNKGVIVADLVRIRTQKINVKYLCYALNSAKISNFINSKQKGTTRPRVKLSIVRELPIPISKNEKEQQKIVQEIEDKFSVIDKIEQVIEASLEKAEKLRKSILKAAFEGKLVKSDEK